MHGSLGHFKDILQRRKQRLEKAEGRFDKKKLINKNIKHKSELSFPTPSKYKLERIKDEIKAKKKKEQLYNYILLVVIFLILFISFYYFMN